MFLYLTFLILEVKFVVLLVAVTRALVGNVKGVNPCCGGVSYANRFIVLLRRIVAGLRQYLEEDDPSQKKVALRHRAERTLIKIL